MAGEAVKLSVDLLYPCVFCLCLDSVTEVASTPMHPSIAVPVFQAASIPPRGATRIGDDPGFAL